MLRETRLAPVPLAPTIRIHTLTGSLEHHWERLGALPYWGHPWPGGQALARHVLDRPGLVTGLRVLDLACGSGLVAVAAALAGAVAVTAADTDPLARAAVALNARANGVRVDVLATDVLATDVLATDGVDRPGREACWDVVLAGDACYEAGLARRLRAFLEQVATLGATALLGDPGRAYCDPTGLRRLACYDVPTPEGAEGSAVTPTVVWQVLAP